MEYKVRLFMVIWKTKKLVCRAYMRDQTLPYPPFVGLEIDGLRIERIEYDTDFSMTTCYMKPYNAFGDEKLFEAENDGYAASGWVRV